MRESAGVHDIVIAEGKNKFHEVSIKIIKIVGFDNVQHLSNY